ncbi:recombination endonuclease VII [Amycolatopsis sulphurea]|uniref:Recombination endonuclease VII n=1 Tax=Amycolatopsis sulphurea TaxID=76022 RepID=A0A2A9FBC1_9PSEU|nr:endonuclease VII domain-containing protein [Amycolatopsis sulphurea]PFG48096.1 recombination endonuclease VII [Amycolatopsis sulphurea]
MTAPAAKVCTHCGLLKPMSEFYRRESSRDGRRGVCAVCTRRAAAIRHQVTRDAARNRRYVTRYGITADDVDELRAAQRYRCALCGRHEDRLPLGLMVDHDHHSGTVRALLCHSCNAGLGHFRESTETLHAAIAYLARGDELLAITETEKN